MNERCYTVKEIDELRRALEQRWLFGTSIDTGFPRTSRGFRRSEMTVCVEELVRTHMMAGHVALDIYDADKRRDDQQKAEYDSRAL